MYTGGNNGARSTARGQIPTSLMSGGPFASGAAPPPPFRPSRPPTRAPIANLLEVARDSPLIPGDLGGIPRGPSPCPSRDEQRCRISYGRREGRGGKGRGSTCLPSLCNIHKGDLLQALTLTVGNAFAELYDHFLI